MLLTPKEKPHKLCVFWKNDCKKHTKFLNDLSFPSKPLIKSHLKLSFLNNFADERKKIVYIYTPPLSRIWKTLLGVIFPSVYCGSILIFIKKQKKVGIHTLHTT